jgi:predicted permease
VGELLRRMGYLLRRGKLAAELENDMAFHREMVAKEGRRNFGNGPRLSEEAREAWGWTWIDRLGQDLRYGVRGLMKSPGFTVTAVLVLAVGIGVNVTAFSLFNLSVLRLLPVRDPQTLVSLNRRSPDQIGGRMPYGSMVFYRDHARTLSAVMAMMGARMEMERDNDAVGADFVTANYFTELGGQAVVGRLLEPGRDDAADVPPVAVLSYRYWQQKYGADPGIVGKVIHLNKKAAIVIGVVPLQFASLDGEHPQIWLSLNQQPYFVDGSEVLADMTTGGGVTMWGRLAPGVTASVAEQELLQLTNELRKQYPKLIWDKEYIHSESAGHLRNLQPPMYLILGMVGALALLILAVACANLGGLLLARGVTREREIGIRVSIGATKMRIFRQLFTESVLLALVGSVAGLVLGSLVLRVTLTQTDAPPWMSALPDWRVLLFAVGLALAASIFFGLAPAWHIAKQRQRKTIARQVLVGAQVAASCVLLIVAALLVRAVHHALYADPGFGYTQVVQIDPELGDHGYSATAARAYMDELKLRLRAVPGVTSVALSKMPPLNDWIRVSYMELNINGRKVLVYPNFVDPEFFQTMEIPLVRGRNLLPGEQHAIVVSESLARRQWPGEDPVGKQFKNGDGKDTVVGVAGNARLNAMSDADAVEMYAAADPKDLAGSILLVKTVGAPDGLVPMVKSITESLDPKLFPEIRLLGPAFKKNMQPVEMAATVVSVMGLVAVVLSAVGLLGLVAYAVSQRMKEIAIRIALGAKRAQVLKAVLRQFAWPVAAGMVAGAGMAGGLSQILRRVLYGVSSLDPASYAGGIALLGGIILVAALLPARRALKLDLAKTLHYE